MPPGNDEARQRAQKRAEAMETSLEQSLQSERDTEALLEKLDKLSHNLFELAQDWESVNPQIATRVRQQEQQIRALRAKVEHLGEFEADEAEQIMAAIRQALKQARGEQG